MRPAELSEPGAGENQLRTEEFDVDDALSNLDKMRGSRDAESVESTETADEPAQDVEDSSDQRKPTEPESTGLISWIKSLF